MKRRHVSTGAKPSGNRGRRGTSNHLSRRIFGQNFLVDPSALAELAQSLPVERDSPVVEIGPGKGALTRELLKRGARVLAVERDPRWVQYLRGRREFATITVVAGDARLIPVSGLTAPWPGATPFLVGNLPYNQAGPILRHFLPRANCFASLHVMVQYEVAKRMAANPGSRDFGYLSVLVQNYVRATLGMRLRPDAFRPRPKVYSAMVHMEPRPTPLCTKPGFPDFAKLAFCQKRKQLVNTLAKAYTKPGVRAQLERMGLPASTRAEQLDVESLVSLFTGLLSEAVSNPKLESDRDP